jgi:hypothetical protein
MNPVRHAERQGFAAALSAIKNPLMRSWLATVTWLTAALVQVLLFGPRPHETTTRHSAFQTQTSLAVTHVRFSSRTFIRCPRLGVTAGPSRPVIAGLPRSRGRR